MIFIFRKMGKYLNQVIYSLVVKGLGAVADLVLPFLLAYMIDELLDISTADNHTLLYVVGLIMLIVAVFGWIFNISANRNAEKVASQTVADVRAELFYKIEHLNGAQVDQISTSSLISRMTTDTYNIYSMVGSLQRLGIRAPMLLIGGIIMAFFMSPILTLVMVALLPFIGMVVYWYTKRGQPLYRDIQGQVDQLIRTLRENITGVRVIRALSMTEHEQKRFEKENRKTVEKEIKATITMNKIRPLIDMIMNVGLVAVLVFGAFQIAQGGSKVGEILALITYLTIILNAMTSITRIFIHISRASASAQRIVEVLNLEDDMIDGSFEIEVNKQPHIEFNNLSFSYRGGKDHLDTIDFKLYQGQTLGIIGSTGAGKTTIINLLMRFYDPQKGSIRIFGKDIKELKRDHLRRHVGLVLQNDLVFSDTIKENIAFSRPFIDDDEVEFAKEIAQANFIDHMPNQFKYHIAQRGTNISGGQRQRILIARAVAGKPKLLVLDDASSALDYQTDRNLRAAIDTHLKDTTKIIIAQRIASIKDADLILVIEEGKIVGKGNHEVLKNSNEHYRTLVLHQLGEDAL